jgi:hypothetical protein
MADQPNGIYQYTSVTISNGVTVTFIPNANNTPVIWLVQGKCEIDGTVDISGQSGNDVVGGIGGPAGFRGGNGGNQGQGPGTGSPAAFGALPTFSGITYTNDSSIYGNQFLLPLLGGSGGGGISGGDGVNIPRFSAGGGGGGGALLIAASQSVELNGAIVSYGGNGGFYTCGTGCAGYAGGASGGAIRIITPILQGSGSISANGGIGPNQNMTGGLGRIRFDIVFDLIFLKMTLAIVM